MPPLPLHKPTLHTVMHPSRDTEEALIGKAQGEPGTLRRISRILVDSLVRR